MITFDQHCTVPDLYHEYACTDMIERAFATQIWHDFGTFLVREILEYSYNRRLEGGRAFFFLQHHSEGGRISRFSLSGQRASIQSALITHSSPAASHGPAGVVLECC